MKITETEYDLKLALEENKELKEKLDAIVKAAKLGLELAAMLNHPYEYDIEQALEQAQKGK